MAFTTVSVFVFALGFLRHPFVSLLTTFLLIKFAWRTVSVMHISAGGEILARQVDKYIPTTSGNAFGVVMLVTLLPFYVILRHAWTQPESRFGPPGGVGGGTRRR